MRRTTTSNAVNGPRTILVVVMALLFGWHVPQVSSAGPAIRVDVGKTMQRLLEEEDTDNDKKITVEDHYAGDGRGDKRFLLHDEKDRQYSVNGTFYLSNLLQELSLYREEGDRLAQLDPGRIFENPVHRITRSIREVFWDALTRSIDEQNLASILRDTKMTTADGGNYLYVPHADEDAHWYFSKLAADHPELKVRVVRLPEAVTAQWVSEREGYHGVLSLALRRNARGGLEGVPYVVPGGRFNEMYGWDSYFQALGLLEDGRIDLARAVVDNLVYQISHYGKILNANRSYYLTRSQPPFLTSLALAVYERLLDTAESRSWLKGALEAAIREYREVWLGKNRRTAIGLSRYFGQGSGPPVEVEPGHFDAVYRKYADKCGLDVATFEARYKTGRISMPALDRFFVHDRAMRESGHDKTFRWGDRCADFVTVDLNSLLYKIEMDLARTIRAQFNDRLELRSGETERSSVWFARAEARKRLMNQYQWDPEHGVFLDYDVVRERREVYITPAVFYPLWAGLASKEQALSTVRAAIPKLEEAGGLVASTQESRGDLSESRPARQWDYPNGWAPHQMLAWQGLINYGFDDMAHRLAYRWLYTITINAVDYNGTVPEKYDVVSRSHRVFAEYGNVGTEFDYITKEGFGWMNASYQVGLALLPPELRSKLERLVPPEWVFER